LSPAEIPFFIFLLKAAPRVCIGCNGRRFLKKQQKINFPAVVWALPDYQKIEPDF